MILHAISFTRGTTQRRRFFCPSQPTRSLSDENRNGVRTKSSLQKGYRGTFSAILTASVGRTESTRQETHSMAHKVLVTGVTGFVATELVKQLLEKGYNVVGSVRDTRSPRVDAVKRLAEALPGQLELHQADILVPGAFDMAVQGCTYVFHTASPFIIEDDNPQKNLVDTAVEGTKNVLNSILAAGHQVKRTVLTSSVAAVHGEYAAPPKNGKLYTEEDFNETSTIECGQGYHLGKTLAEQAAWDISKKHKLDLVTICPNFVLGPILSSHADSLSIGFIKGVLEGAPIDGTFCVCDVRDVASAHILAAETESAHGRYIVSQKSTLPTNIISETLQRRFPDYDIQTGAKQEAADKLDNSRSLTELGLRSHSAEATFVDMAVTAVQLGLAKPKLKQ